MPTSTIWIIVGVLAVIVIALIVWRVIVCMKAREILAECTQKQDNLSFEEVIAYFKDAERLAVLKADTSKIAVAVKQDTGAVRQVVLCLYDKTKKELVMEPPCYRIYEVKNVAKDLENAFGDKDMLVLS